MNSTLVVRPIMALPNDQDHTGRDLGEEEIDLLKQVIATGTLTSTKGTFTRRLEELFAKKIGIKHAYACTSGTAALHIAIAAIDPNPGDEIVTTSITDMGALTPMLYQGAIPVFAEVDPVTVNVTAETIAAKISPKTKAIMVTHLFGNPCIMGPIMELAHKHNIPVIEDCAQAFMAKENGQFVGTFGTISCFSTQQGKHMTTGEGGLVCTNDDALGRRCFLLINKAWGYGDPKPDHYFAALNYRMSEIQSAVALAQLNKLDSVADRRIKAANKLDKLLAGIKGIQTPRVAPGAVHTYWKYCLTVDGNVIKDGAVGLAGKLKERGIASAPRYIQKPSFMCEVFQKRRTFGTSGYPFNLARPEAVDYDKAKFPMTFKALEDVLVLPWNELYTDEHINYIADSIRECVEALR